MIVPIHGILEDYANSGNVTMRNRYIFLESSPPEGGGENQVTMECSRFLDQVSSTFEQHSGAGQIFGRFQIRIQNLL